MEYDPAVEVKILENTIETLKLIYDPEKTAMAYLSAQAQGNYDWYFSLLSASLQQKLTADLASSGRTVDDLVREWRSRFQDGKVELTHRIERGSYSIIHYRIISMTNGVLREEGDIAIGLSSESGRAWVVTDLKRDLIYENWNFEGTTKIILLN